MSVLFRIMLVAALPICSIPCIAQDTVKQEVVGLSFMKVDPESDFGQAFVLGHEGGTKVYVNVSIADSKILSIKSAKKSNISLTTDSGKKLKIDPNADIGFYSNISDEGTSVVVPVAAKELPPEGTKSISVEAKVVLVMGDDLKDEQIELKLEEDAEFDFNGNKIKVAGIEDGFQEDQKMVNFETNSSLDTIQKISFVTSDGKTVEAEPAGSSSFGFDDNMTYNYNFAFEGDPSKITGAKVKFYAKTVEKEVELNHSVTLGF